MQRDIKSIMEKVLETVPGSRTATVWLQRPLQAGIQIEAEVVSKNGGEYVIVENDEDFLSFAQSYEADAPWNRMTLHLSKKGNVSIETSFDRELEADALEKTK